MGLDSEKVFGTTVPVVAASLIPVVRWMQFYTNNAQHMALKHVLITGLAMVLASLALCLLMAKLFKSAGAALLWCLCFWTVFFLYADIYRTVFGGKTPHWFLLLVLAFLLAGTFFGIRFINKKPDITKAVSAFLSAIIVVLVVYNGAMSVGLSNAYAYGHPNGSGAKIKKDFVVDPVLPSPNIYWLHFDGMLGFDAVEKYFGDPQEAFREQLWNRGFAMNPSAALAVYHTTDIAIPALMSPAYYDNELYDILYNYTAGTATKLLDYKELFDVRLNSEMRVAFEKKGYTTITLADIERWYPPTTNLFFTCVGEKARLFERENMPADDLRWFMEFRSRKYLYQVLNRTTALSSVYDQMLLPLLYKDIENKYSNQEVPDVFSNDEMLVNASRSFEDGYNYVAMANALNMSFQKEGPKLVFLHSTLPHSPYIFDEDGNYAAKGSRNLKRYHGNHTYSAKVLMRFIDLILENDPDALIVIQADHGVQNLENEILDMFSPDDPENVEPIIELWNSTMSAVRVPAKYGAFDEMPIPVNMARVLINNFVGWNYEYLDGADSDLY